MSYFKEYREHIEYAFAAFCKIVLYNAAMSAYRNIGRKRKHEISLDYLMEEHIIARLQQTATLKNR